MLKFPRDQVYRITLTEFPTWQRIPHLEGIDSVAPSIASAGMGKLYRSNSLLEIEAVNA